MAEFRYRARNPRGELVVGRLDADSPDAVARQLFSNGVTPVEIDEVVERPDALRRIGRLLGADKPGLDDVLLFSRQMHALVRAGVPLASGLQSLAASARNPIMREIIREVVDTLGSGRDLATSLSRHPRVFSPLYVSVIRVGESAGRLEEAFLRMHEYLQRDKETRRQIQQALRYPVLVSLAIAAAVGVVTVLVIPAFGTVFERAELSLPWSTRAILAVSGFMAAHWMALGIGLAGAGLAAHWWVGSDTGRYRWDKIKLRLPLIGEIVRRAMLGRFARTFAMCAGAGVPLIQALTLVANATGNQYLSEHVLGMRNGVERGESLSRTAQVTGLFTPLVLQMLAVGEESGSIDEMMGEVAEYYEREVEYDVRNLSARAEPLLLVAMGAMVLVLALGVFVPMWDLTQAAR